MAKRRTRNAASTRTPAPSPGKAFPPPSFGIFAEGATYTDLRKRDMFTELWRELCRRLAVSPPTVHVFGISKAQIVALGEPMKTPGSREALDVLIRREHKNKGFDVAIIAFDRIPKNQLVPHDCMRAEVNFVLERFLERQILPPLFLDEAQRLLESYAQSPKCSRGVGRPPRGCLDTLYMDPMFEGLFLTDESSVLHALGHKRRPKDWPPFNVNALHPDHGILGRAVKLATQDVCGVVHGNMKTNKHGWAFRIVNQAPDNARLFQHPIAQRLRDLLA